MGDEPTWHGQKLETVSATEAVVNRLLEMITAGQLRPGDQLPSEEQLSAAFGVGRSSIREAKRLLAARDLIEGRVGVGTFVREQSVGQAIPRETLHSLLSQQALAALHEAREVLEVRCAELAAERADAEDIARLDVCLEEMRLAAAAGRSAYRAGHNFHIGLVAATHNPVLELIYEVVVDLLQIHQVPMPDPVVEHDSHRVLYDALVRRDREELGQLMRAHLRYVKETAAPA